jgi:hypothetical protein
VRDPALHELLQAFTTDTAAALTTERADGAEVPFEIEELESRRGRPPLYCYRPLTGQFIQHRMGRLSGLASYAPAARAVASRDRAQAYLWLRGAERIPEEPRERADAVLLSFLARVFSDRSEFELDFARFEAAYAELEQALLDGRGQATMIVPLLGLGLEERSWQIELDQELSLVRGDRLGDAPPEAVWAESGEPQVLAVLRLTQDRSEPLPVSAAAERFRRLLTTIRLFERGTYGLGALGWARIDFGSWHPVAVGGGGTSATAARTPSAEAAAAAPRTVIPARQEEELRGFCTLMSRRLPAVESGSFGSPEVAWALSRFDLGCDRSIPVDGLSDHLLALGALLEPAGPASSHLPQRLALICAPPEDRAALAERLAEAVGLERALVTGLPRDRGRSKELAGEVAEYLRALLRDVLCGHLPADLVGVAERVLADELAATPA